jgi:hypothetical protein
MSNTSEIQITNAERTQQLNTAAQKALLKGIARDWKACEEVASDLGKLTIKGVNLLRVVGEQIKQVTGHEQVGFDFWQRHHAVLPASLTYAKAKCAVHVANRNPKPVTTVQEAMAAQRDLFAAMAEYTEPKRLAAQTGHDRNLWSDLVSGVASLDSIFHKLNPSPMAQWRRDELEKFVETTKPLVQRAKEAATILEETVTMRRHD